MKKFMLMTIGFEPPTPEVFAQWKTWFGSIQDKIVENATQLGMGKEITKEGTRDLPKDLHAITGYLVVQAETLEEAQHIARGCPIVTSIRVYEIRSM